MTKLFLFLALATVISTNGQDKFYSTNASFLFFDRKDTISADNPVIRISSRALSFEIQSETKFKAVTYKYTVASGAKAVDSGTRTVHSHENYISWMNYYAKPNDRLVVEIMYLEGEDGKKYRPDKRVYSFTIR